MLPVGEDSPPLYRPRALSVRHAAGESFLVSVGPGGISLRSSRAVSARSPKHAAAPPASNDTTQLLRPAARAEHGRPATPVVARALGGALRPETPVAIVASLDDARVASRPSSLAAQPLDAPQQPAVAAVEPPHRARSVAQAMPPCQAELWLAGSVVNEARPRLSLAVVRKPAGTAVVPLGGRIDDFTVVAIESARAALQTADGARCALSAVSGASPSVAPAPAPPPRDA